MRILAGEELETAERYLIVAGEQARDRATCKKARCGTVIVKGFTIIGMGYNSPPGDNERNRKCDIVSGLVPNPRHDQTCCMHAEWRGIHDALSRHDRSRLNGSILYFERIGLTGYPQIAGKPYCTVCSRLALDVGISEFVLRHPEGITAYDTVEYNDLSYAFEKGP